MKVLAADVKCDGLLYRRVLVPILDKHRSLKIYSGHFWLSGSGKMNALIQRSNMEE